MFRSATFKLTLWYLALVMAISLMFSGVLYSVTTNELSRGLRRETQRIFREYPGANQFDPRFRPPAPDVETGSHRILTQLISFNIIVLVGAGFASYYLARRTLQPIEEAHEQQKRFTADVTHELRTPLTAIKMESEVALLNAKASTPQLRETLKSNLEEVDKLQALINNLLRLSHLEANEVQKQFKAVDSSDIIESALAQVDKQAAAKNIILNSKLSSAKVQGDHDSLVQLLVILLDNAVKYSSDNQTVSINPKIADNKLVIDVKDSGPGIAKADLEHVFDRFYRADTSRNQNSTSGFGLGLSIAKTIVDLHGGIIELKSKKGKGTTARLVLALEA